MKNLLLISGRKFHQGISLIGILVGLAVGTIIIAALTQLFVTFKQNYKLVNNLSSMISNAQQTILFLENNLSYAGLGINDDTTGLAGNAPGAYNPSLNTPYLNYHVVVTPSPNVWAGDTVSVTYKNIPSNNLSFGNPYYGIPNCLESSSQAMNDIWATNTISSTGPTGVGSTNGSIVNNTFLTCSVATNSSPTPTGLATPFISNVEHMRVLVGENTSQYPRNVNRYLSYNDPSLQDAANIVSLRVGFVIRSDDQILPGLPNLATPITLPNMYDSTGAALTFTPPSVDQYLRKAFSVTIFFKSYNQPSYKPLCFTDGSGNMSIKYRGVRSNSGTSSPNTNNGGLLYYSGTFPGGELCTNGGTYQNLTPGTCPNTATKSALCSCNSISNANSCTATGYMGIW
ncbi:MAG: Type Pilus-assembly protein [Francisellaceae bacterium]|nr:Type Pilus-assembly protein [Francisellaceae bacterium]